MRPLYETEADLEREAEVASLIERRWNCKLVKMPIRYHLDFVAIRGDKVVAFCEVKTRNYTMEQITNFGGYLMSVGKWTNAHALNTSTGIPFVLIVKTSDGVYYASFDATNFKPDDVLTRGRKDRNDWQDIEPCVLLNTKQFKEL